MKVNMAIGERQSDTIEVELSCRPCVGDGIAPEVVEGFESLTVTHVEHGCDGMLTVYVREDD